MNFFFKWDLTQNCIKTNKQTKKQVKEELPRQNWEWRSFSDPELLSSRAVVPFGISRKTQSPEEHRVRACAFWVPNRKGRIKPSGEGAGSKGEGKYILPSSFSKYSWTLFKNSYFPRSLSFFPQVRPDIGILRTCFAVCKVTESQLGNSGVLLFSS